MDSAAPAGQVRPGVVELDQGEGRALTVSLGIALFRPDDTPKSLTLRAEEALYQAKKLGRNRTEVQG